jgi:hypothetical protein
MKGALTITDLTRMQGDRVCIAGYLPDGMCARPVFEYGALTERWLHVNGSLVVRPFAVIEFDFQGIPYRSLPPHTEDRIIDPQYRVLCHGRSPEERADWLAKVDDGGVESIFGTAVHREHGTFVLAGDGTRSLGTVRVRRIEEVQFTLVNNTRWDYRLIFTDHLGQRYRLPVTDLAFRAYLNYLRDQREMPLTEIAQSLTLTLQKLSVFLRIGLARGWDQYPDRCYVQVTGIYSFPDYLSGRCFADFAPSEMTGGTDPVPSTSTVEGVPVPTVPSVTPVAANEGLLAKLSRFFRA